MKISFIPKTLALCCSTLLAATNVHAQAQSPADCRQGCTSNDVQIIRAFQVDPATNQELGNTFVCSGTSTVKLGLELTTQTPRKGVVVYANIKDFSTGSPTTILVTEKECFGIALNQPTNRVVFQQTFGWSCGMPIVLTDVFLAWGTGNTDYCQGSSAFRCPGTPSKCFQLPQGQYIPIQVPTSNTASATLCANPAGGSTATFNLTTLKSAVAGSQTNVVVSWYSDSGLSAIIADSTAYVSPSGTVYAKVANAGNASAYSSATVTLTVTQSPATPAFCATQPSLCGPATGSITISSPTGTGYEYSVDSGVTWQTALSFTGLAAGSNPTVIAKFSGCWSAAAPCTGATACGTVRMSNNTSTSPKKSLRTVTPIEAAPSGELQVKAYPNPFRNSVNFNIATPVSGRVLLEMFDVTGRRIASMNYGYVEAGTVRTVSLNLKKNINAMILYRLTVGRQSVSGRLLQND